MCVQIHDSVGPSFPKCLNSTAVRLRLKKTTRVSLKKVCSGMNKQLPFRCTLSLKTNRLTKKNPQRVTPLCFYLTPRHVNPNYKKGEEATLPYLRKLS